MKRVIFFICFLICAISTEAQSHNEDFPNLSLSVYSDLANGCSKSKNMKFLIARTWGVMLENEIQSKISLIKSCNKEAAYKLLNALYDIQQDLFKENLHAIGLSVKQCMECENAILTIRKKELDKVKAEESSILDKWIKEGVPANVAPNVSASLNYSGIAKTAKFIESLDKYDRINYLIKVGIEVDGSISSVHFDTEEINDSSFLFNLFSFDELSVKHPAYYNFANIDKGIAMSSVENVSISESRKSITHYEPWDAPEYQAGDFDCFTLTVKYDLKKNTIKIMKYEDDDNWFDSFCANNNLDKTYFINNDIKKYLCSKSFNGKVKVKFLVRKRKVVVRHGGELLAEQEIMPKLIIVNTLTK